MSHPGVRVNTFTQDKDKPFVDLLSKTFIACGLILGVNRLTVPGNVKIIYSILVLVYATLFISVLSYLLIADNENNNLQYRIMLYSKISQYIVCAVIGFTSWKKLQNYYKELAHFDMEVGCRPKSTWGSILILLQMIMLIILTTALLISCNLPLYLPFHLIQTLENHFYGHLLNLLIRRLRLLNFYLDSTLSKGNSITCTHKDQFVKFNKTHGIFYYLDMNSDKLMEYYHIIIKAYYLLVDAIKYQMLLMISTSFCYILAMSYFIALGLMRKDVTLEESAFNTMIAVLEIVPLIVPCLCGDLLRAEVRQLRELLASRLNEAKQDKRIRSTARALLALIEARPLSFSLFRMVDISISLPFSLMGLLVTYLIILIQFEKVLYPTHYVGQNVTY